MYRYETHLHSYPVSKCAQASVREQLTFYKSLGYDGVFLTNHFLDGNINVDPALSYDERLAFYLSDYEEAKTHSAELGIKVFFGVELSYEGTHFLVYGLDPDWYRAHPEIMEMKMSEELAYLMEQGALVIQAHPFREAEYIDHIRLFPRSVHGVEVFNAVQRTDFENEMAQHYAERYGLLPFAGSDNHRGEKQRRLAGMCAETPIADERDFAERVKNGEMELFILNRAE